jgi:hypothetical protein
VEEELSRLRIWFFKAGDNWSKSIADGDISVVVTLVLPSGFFWMICTTLLVFLIPSSFLKVEYIKSKAAAARPASAIWKKVVKKAYRLILEEFFEFSSSNVPTALEVSGA